MLVLLDRIVAMTRLGKGIRAVAQDAETASLMGVDIDRIISQTFVLGGLLGGAAGFLFGLSSGVVYTMGFTPGPQGLHRRGARRHRQHPRRRARRACRSGSRRTSASPASTHPGATSSRSASSSLVLLVRPTGILGERLGRSA